MPFDLDHRTKLFLKELYRDYHLKSRTRHNHIQDLLEMSQVEPITPRESRIQTSVVNFVNPLMIEVIKSKDFDTPVDALVESVKMTEKAFASQMSGVDKKQFALGLAKSVLVDDETDESYLSEMIDLIVKLSKDKDIHKVFIKGSKFCLSCCSKSPKK